MMVPSRGPPVRHSLLMSTKPVNTRTTTATRAGCIWHEVGHKTPFPGCGSRNATGDPDPTYSSWTPRACCRQDLCHSAASLYEQGFHHRPTGDSLQNCGQASDSQLFTSWVNPEQESWPCHVCPWAVRMVTVRSVSRTIRDWVVVRRRCRIQDH